VSTRPGATVLTETEELDRVLPLIENIRNSSHAILRSIPISIDTFRATVAAKACKAGASMINDVSAGTIDRDMFKVVARLGVPYIMMHMRGVPATMMDASNTSYENVTS
jgi:dihydropteroate synthase